LAAVAGRVFGEFGSSLIIAGGVISIFGSLSGSILSYPRVLFGGAESGWLPSFMAKIHPRFATPYWAIIVYAILDFVFAISGGFKQLAIISSSALLLIYLGVVLAVIKFRINNLSDTKPTFRLPFGLTIPIIATISILWFLTNLAAKEFIGLAVFVVILSLIYWVLQRQKR
jgi:amino acid transporter